MKLKQLKDDIESAANLGFFNEDAFIAFCNEYSHCQKVLCVENYDIGDTHDPDLSLIDETILSARKPDIGEPYPRMGTVEPVVGNKNVSKFEISLIRGCIDKYMRTSIDRDEILRYILQIIRS